MAKLTFRLWVLIIVLFFSLLSISPWLYFDKGVVIKSIDKIADAVGLHRRAVHDILHRFEERGLKAADGLPKPGRKNAPAFKLALKCLIFYILFFCLPKISQIHSTSPWEYLLLHLPIFFRPIRLRALENCGQIGYN